MLYNVIWEIDIEADSMQEAAEKARAYHLDPCSTATFYNVTDEEGNIEEIELPYLLSNT